MRQLISKQDTQEKHLLQSTHPRSTLQRSIHLRSTHLRSTHPRSTIKRSIHPKSTLLRSTHPRNTTRRSTLLKVSTMVIMGINMADTTERITIKSQPITDTNLTTGTEAHTNTSIDTVDLDTDHSMMSLMSLLHSFKFELMLGLLI